MADAKSNSSLQPAKMKAIVFTHVLEEPKGMKIMEYPRPEPKENEILIRVKYFGLNYADVLARKGVYGDAPPFPFICGYECSGEVVACGSKTTKFQIGQKVLAFTNFGSYAEYAVAPELGVVEVPPGMTLAEAASIPVVFATAYYCIHCTGSVFKGDKVLIHAAAGGVGLAAVQLAKLSGLVVYGTASNAEKIKMLKEKYNVDHVINYRESDFATAIQKIEGHKNPCLDLVLDSIGGSYLKKELPLIRPGGRLIGYGASSVYDRSLSQTFSLISNVVSMVTMSSIDLMLGAKSFVGVNMKRFSEARPDAMSRILLEVMELFKQKKLSTCVTKVYNWKEIDQAHRDIESRGTTGKLVLQVGDANEGN